MVSTSYLFLIFAVVVQRLLEVRVSRQHEEALKAQGATEHAPEQMPVMIAVHSTWLLSCLIEAWLRGPHATPRWLTIAALLVFSCGQALRLAAMSTLGERWTVRIIALPGVSPVTHGIFRYLRHPNYVGVILEIAALPLVVGSWVSAVVFSAANGLLLMWRISAEEHALADRSDYAERFRGRPRLLPKLGPSAFAARSTGAHQTERTRE